MNPNKFKILTRFLILSAFSFGLTACGGGGDTAAAAAAVTPTPTPTNADCVLDTSIIGDCTL